MDKRSKELNGYIYHATGSGKTLTSFKLCDVLSRDSSINKIIFLVDRIDLNAQTLEQFKKFSDENLDETNSSSVLEKQLLDPTKKIIVTTIQKMHRLLNKNDAKFIKNHKDVIENNNIFIVDECHRTQFGEMHKQIRKSFIHSRLIGFTGTPIYKTDAIDFQTTSDIFGEELHSYKMKDAITDGNVLQFKIQYVKGPNYELKVAEDIENEQVVDKLDIDGFFKSQKYIEKVTKFIGDNIKKKNTSELKTMLTTSSIDNAIKFYWEFRKMYPDLNIATIFSFLDNDRNIEIDEHSKHKLDEIIQDHNKTYNKSFSINDLKKYYLSIQNNLKNKKEENLVKIQLIIVVNMLTTGFDCEYIDTIYLDRKLQTHNLIQTISRANRIYNNKKPRANIISLRTFKKDADHALRVYNGDSTGYIDEETLDSFIEKLKNCIAELKQKWTTPDDAAHIVSEQEQKEFIIIIRTLNKLLSIVKTFLEFNMNMISITQDEINGYNGIYQNIYQKVKNDIITAEIIQDIDFELEIFEDEISVDYIANLLNDIVIDKSTFEIELSKIMEKIKNISSKSKRELIEGFIEEWKNKMMKNDNTWKDQDTKKLFYDYKISKIINTIKEYCERSNLDVDKIIMIYKNSKFEDKMINSYSKDIDDAFIKKPGLIERQKLIKSIKSFIIDLDTTEIDYTSPENRIGV